MRASVHWVMTPEGPILEVKIVPSEEDVSS